MDGLIAWSPGTTLAEIEKQVILKAFRHYRGNKTATSNALGISIRTLDSRLEEYEKAGKEQELKNARESTERERFLARQRGNVTTDSYGGSVLNRDQPQQIANTAETPKAGQGSVGVNEGVRVESASQARPQQTVSMPQRAEVQGMSPKQVAPRGPNRGR